MLQTIRRNRPRRGERGAAMVEFALILPLLMSLVLGLVTGGAAYNRKLSMTGSVREAARFGATLNGVADWATRVQTRTVELAAGDLTADQVCVQLVKKDTGTVYETSGCGFAAAAPATPASAATGDCLVKVWAQRPDRLQAMFFSTDLTLKAGSVSRYEGTVSGSCS